jgi:transposase
MSDSLIHHAFGIRGYRYRHCRFEDGKMIVRIEQPRESFRCSACGSGDVFSQGAVKRTFRSLPIGSRPVRIELAVPRVRCRNCGLVRQVRVQFAEAHHRSTKRFERYVLDLLEMATVQDVARHLQVSWDTIRKIEQRHLEQHYAKPKLKHVRRLAIDEISIGRRHRYLTVVIDVDSGRVLFVGKGKGTAALNGFWPRLRAAHAKVEAVAIDMSPAYISAVMSHLPAAQIVFDRFHIMKLFNDRLSNLRRDLYREASDSLAKNVLKGTRWLLLKNWENLDEDQHESQRLEDALKLNQPLATAYYLKEELRQLWEQPGVFHAELFLNDWCARARASGIRMLQKFANTLESHRSGILAWYDHAISTGPLEGLNNKIKTMQRQSYGFRNHEYLKLKILAIHRSQYALVG